MPKYIKSKDGKFAGSIGEGKTAVPTPAPTHAPNITPDSQISRGEEQVLDDIYAHFTAARYTHHEKTVTTITRVLEERFPGLSQWSISVEQQDRDYAPDVHLGHVVVDGEKIYDRFNASHSESDLEEELGDPELTKKLLDVENLAQRLEDPPTLTSLATRTQTNFVSEDETVLMYYFDIQEK